MQEKDDLQNKFNELKKFSEQQQSKNNKKIPSELQIEQLEAYKNEIQELKRENEQMMQILIKR